METDFIKQIKDNYDIKGDFKNIKNIDGYPHIQRISFEDDFILKKINKIYCKDIETLYNYLSQSTYVELPLKTIDGNYGLSINDKQYILYPRIKKIKGPIQSFWWAKALESIHNIPVDVNDFNQEYTIEHEAFSLLEQSSEIVSNKARKVLYRLLDKYYQDRNVNKMVLSHGDPYDKNVMNDKTHIKLIDTDGVRLLPEEFDIARLFYNEVNGEDDLKKIDQYINIFFYNYKNEIDMNLLKKLYVMDLIRSFSWLSIITKDNTRADLTRQKEELKEFKEGILSGRHEKVLKKL